MSLVKDEKDISIKELLCYVSLKWRRILLFIILSMVLVVTLNIRSAYKYTEFLSTNVIISAIIKRMILVGAVTGVFSIFCYILKFILADTIKSVNEFYRVCDIKVIGCFTSEKKHSKIDELIKKAFGLKILKEDISNCASYAAKIIEVDIVKELNTDEVVLALISSDLKMEEIEYVRELLNKYMSKKVRFIPTPEIDTHAEAIDKVIESDGVILIEKRGISKYSNIEKKCNRILSWNKNIMGVILLDMDEM